MPNMDALSTLNVVLGGSWATGLNLYMTVAGLGIMNRIHLVTLPGSLDAISHPLVIAVAGLMYLIEFVADKIPFVDSAWDSIHTLIRPLGGATLSYMATADVGPLVQIPVALVSGAIAMSSHLTKAGARVAINTSPEPVTNSIASVTEDGLVFGVLWLIAKHPVIATIVILGLIALFVWLLIRLFRFVRKVFKFLLPPQPHAP